MSLLSILEQSCFSFERMQAPGFVLGMIPGFKKIYGDQKEEVAAAMQNNMDFINTEPHMATFLQGLILSLEENGQDRALIKNIKTGCLPSGRPRRCNFLVHPASHFSSDLLFIGEQRLRFRTDSLHTDLGGGLLLKALVRTYGL